MNFNTAFTSLLLLGCQSFASVNAGINCKNGRFEIKPHSYASGGSDMITKQISQDGKNHYYDVNKDSVWYIDYFRETTRDFLFSCSPSDKFNAYVKFSDGSQSDFDVRVNDSKDSYVNTSGKKITH
eukprot:Pgem_evm1s12675